jgi:hypothetical protein
VDQCGQVGFVINNFGLRDYDPSGIQIAESNFSANANSTDDLLLLPDDDLLRTLRQAHRLARDDPHPHLFVVVEELSVDGYPWISSLFSSLRRSRRRTKRRTDGVRKDDSLFLLIVKQLGDRSLAPLLFLHFFPSDSLE